VERKFVVFYDPVTDEVMFAYREYYDGRATASVGFDPNGRLQLKRLEPGEHGGGATFRLPIDIARLLGDGLKAAGMVTPDPKPVDETPAIKAHLQDTQVIRDRLLTLFEKKV
jgi:hypothetical protein